MPSLRPLPPETVRRLLEQDGYTLIGDDGYNWAFTRNPTDAPLMIPYRVPYVPLALMNSRLRQYATCDPTDAEIELAESRIVAAEADN